MGRPRASEKNLAIAFSLADVITKKCSRNVADCRGKNSIFRVMTTCVPGLLRCSDESGVKNRNGITESELNKYLVKCGFSKSRDRTRVKGTSDKWDEGCPKWKGREWMNPSDDNHIGELKGRLRECLAFTTNLNLDMVANAIISNLKSIRSDFSQSGQRSGGEDEFTVSKSCEGSLGIGDRNLVLCQDVPRMCMTVHHRSILGEVPRYRWPAGLERVPRSFGPVFHAFYQVLQSDAASHLRRAYIFSTLHWSTPFAVISPAVRACISNERTINLHDG
jgi:hypothetical protein